MEMRSPVKKWINTTFQIKTMIFKLYSQITMLLQQSDLMDLLLLGASLHMVETAAVLVNSSMVALQ